MEVKEDFMLSPAGDNEETLRTTHFLKPIANSIEEPAFKFNPFSSSSSSVFEPNELLPLKFHFQEKWVRWVDELKLRYETVWKNVGIFEAIMRTKCRISRNKNLLYVIVEKWCSEINTFVFPFGEATITLEDVMVLEGYPILLGDPVFTSLDEDREMREVEKKLILARKDLTTDRKQGGDSRTSLWVTDLAFFAEDVHLLASVGTDGRVFVWKISEGPDDEDKPQITANIVIAIQIVGEEKVEHPQICWHCHKQEILIVGMGRHVLRIDTTKVGNGEAFVAEDPPKCPLDKLIDGVRIVGTHDEEVTDMSMCQWMTNRLVSASQDGTIKIWEDRKTKPLAIFRPHDGHPVFSATFFTAPHQPGHTVLITAGPQNREVKVWVSTSEEGWLLPSDTESWKCIQTLELNSSAKPTLKDAFFNQVAALPHAGLLLLANAQRNAIYAVHLEYGPNPESTRMDYLAEFTVTMPILSFTGTSDILPHGKHIVQVYCVQTQAIQQYALDLAQCLPPSSENVGLDKSDSSVSRDVITAEGFTSLESSAGRTSEISLPSSAPKIMMQASSTDSGLVARYPLSSGHIEAPISREISSSNIEAKTVTLAPSSSDADIVCVPSPRLPLSPRLSRKLSDFRSPQSNLSDHVGDQAVNDYSVERQMDTIHRNLSDQLNSDLKNDESERQGPQQNPVSDGKEKLFCSQASDLGIEMARECGAIGGESYITEQTGHVDSTGGDSLAQRSNAGEDTLQDLPKDVHEKVSDSSTSMVAPPSPAPNAKGKRQKGKNSQPSGPSSPSPSACNSTDSSNEPNGISNLPSTENGLPQIMAMQESINQLLTMQKEMQKQMTMIVAAPVTKESKRLEAVLGKSMEKAKSNADALRARIQEENAKNEKLLRDRIQQVTTGLITNFMNKDLPSILEKTVKKEMGSVWEAVIRSMSPAIEKIISPTIVETFQRGVGDKAVNQLDNPVNSKLEVTVARQIQAQFQTAAKQALQDALKSSFETSVAPAFEMSYKAMFEQVDTTFQEGLAEHSNAVQQHLESGPTSLAMTLRVDKRCDKSTEGDMLFGNHDFIKVTEGDDVNVAVKETSHSQNSTLTMRKTTQTSTLSISRKPSFKPIYRKPSNKDCMLIKWRQTITPQIIVPYDYYDYNQDEEFIALTIIHFPENPRNTISNPMDDGFPIGALGGECLNSVIRGLVFVVGRGYHRVGNPTIRSISPVTQHPTMLDSDLFLLKYSMGYDDILNLYKIVRFISLNNRAGTVIHAFTIGVDDDWRVVGFSDLLIIFDQWIPNEGIQTLGSGPHYLVHQSSQVHFSCENQLVLSFDFLTEQVRNRLIPANIQGIPTLCVLQNTLCLSELHDNILRIHRSIGIDWMLWFQVDILFRIPELTRYMQLPICLHENLLLLAFYGQFPLPGDPFYRYQHGVVVNVATGAVDLVDGFSQMDWFLAKTFVGSSEVLPY